MIQFASHDSAASGNQVADARSHAVRHGPFPPVGILPQQLGGRRLSKRAIDAEKLRGLAQGKPLRERLQHAPVGIGSSPNALRWEGARRLSHQ
jgi:hypothetical protein